MADITNCRGAVPLYSLLSNINTKKKIRTVKVRILQNIKPQGSLST